ncbi:hypothetical protein CaCOL14_004933 [Colletotrichum acutatum]
MFGESGVPRRWRRGADIKPQFINISGLEDLECFFIRKDSQPAAATLRDVYLDCIGGIGASRVE